MESQFEIDKKTLPGKTVTLLRGHGYHNLTNGIDSFHRSTMNINGKIKHFVSYVEIYVDLHDGRYIKTTYNCLNIK